ncbi:MAG: hypothetical protein J6T88_03195 [Bacteroidales bacterium]|nr:hypothetical protein [Bacteroidales bacterium]
MKKIFFIVSVIMLVVACSNKETQMKERAMELCKYIPDHEMLEQSKDFMTEDFYAVLDTMFNLPNHEAMDHEWLYYFVTGNGGTIADYEVLSVEMIDKTNAVATIIVRQKWEDGSFDESSDIEEHKLYMKKEGGQWLMSDFDGHKADCIRHIAINREEQAVRQAVSNYLRDVIGPHYLQGELCIPTLMMVYEDSLRVWGDFWVFWYNQVGDTLMCVSGGNHSGLMTLDKEDGEYRVMSFDQTEDGSRFLSSAKRVFGGHFDIFWNMHSNEGVREAVRMEQLREYKKQKNLAVHYLKDYGWPAVEI